MRAPFRAVVCALALGVAGGLHAADDSANTPAAGTANALRYPLLSQAAANAAQPAPATPTSTAVVITPTTVTSPAAGIQAAPGTFNTTIGAAPVPTQRPDPESAPVTADLVQEIPRSGATSADASSAAGPKSSIKVSPWRPIQTAFRQLAGSKAGTSGPAPEGEVVPSNVTPGFVGPSTPRIPPQAARADGIQPSTTGQDYVEKPFAKSARASTENPMGGEIVYGGPPGTGGCGCGPSGDAAICPNCGGWQPGTCRTNNPEGSCICQRLACCLCKPYPDCSNGCVDFCHSWIFHEDDCWLTSNHKCCNPNCGPYPYGSCPNDGMGKGNGCGCGNCGPCVPAPDLYFSAEALTLSRYDNVGSQSLAEIGGTSVLGTQDFGFDSDWRTGPRFVLGYSPTPMDAWEFSYFGLQHWSEDRSVASPTDLLALPGDLGTLTEFSGASLIQATYSSEIHDAEVNYSWHHGCKALSWIAGFRYFRLDEQIDMTSTVTGLGLGEYDARTVNNLYGGQLGARYNISCHQFQWDCTAKAGAFGNSIESLQFAAPVGGMIVRDTRAIDSRWAFVGEFGSNVRYFFCKNWCATAGFNVLWVDGVALAPDQLDFTNTPTSGLTVNHDGNAMYVGGHVGVGVRF